MTVKNCQLSFASRLTALLLLSGCMVGPNYRRPMLDVPETFHYEVEEAQNTLDIKWWERFEDPVLSSLIVEALDHNKNVKIAAANVENAVGILIQIRAPLFPQVGYDASYSRSRNSMNLQNFDLPDNAIDILPFSISIPRY